MLTNVNDENSIFYENEPELEISQFEDVNNNCDDEYITNMLMKLPESYADDYDTWIKIGFILYNYFKSNSNDEKKYFEMWNNFSKRSKKYNLKECKTHWKSFNNNNDEKKLLTLGTLKMWCKNEKIILNDIEKIVNNYDEKYLDNEITFSSYKHVKKMNKEKLIPNDYKGLEKYRLFCVKSEKGTGKTFNLIEYIFNNEYGNNLKVDKNTTMLFVSSRRTFGAKLLGDLKKYDFKLYSNIENHSINEKRIICQADSLYRLNTDKFDIVFVDECESFLRYITSEHFKNNINSTRNRDLFELRINEANNVILMDADLSDRSLNYVCKILNQFDDIDDEKTNFTNENIYIIDNDYKYYKDYKIYYTDKYTWINIIKEKLKNNNKIVVPMASNEEAKNLCAIINDLFPNKNVLLIHKETTNNNKIKQLLNVNTTWIDYDVIIYTPTVCMGVSFDINNHFDYIFAYGCHNSLCSLEFNQMFHRVRNPKNKCIFLAIDVYKKFSIENDIFSKKMVEKLITNDYYLTKYNINTNFLAPKIVKNKYMCKFGNEIDNDYLENETVLFYKSKNDPIYELAINNIKERLENNVNFSYQLIANLKQKKYNIYFYGIENECRNEIKENLKNVSEKRKSNEKKIELEGIINAPFINFDEYYKLINSNNENLSKDDVYKIKKYKCRKIYEIPEEDMNEDFINKYYDENLMKYYNNLSTMLNSKQTTLEKLNILRMKEYNKYELNFNNCF